MDEWKPIETAPKYKDVLICGTDGILVAWLGDYKWNASNVESSYDMAKVLIDVGKITHWMPLPDKPNDLITGAPRSQKEPR